MKSSETGPESPNSTANQSLLTIQHPFYALLAVYIPLSVLAGLLPSLNSLAALTLGPAPVLLWFFSGLLSALFASIYWAIVKKSKADHSAANIRGAVLIVAGIYCLGSLTRLDLPLGARFLPSFDNFLSSVIALFIWFPVLVTKRVFEGQELIASYTRVYDGEKLRQVMLEDSGLMSEADIDMEKLIARYRMLFLLPFVLFVVTGFLPGIQSGAHLAVFLALLFIAGVAIIVFLGLLRKEYAFAAEGLVFTSRPKVMLAGIIVILASAALGFLLSTGKNFLPFSIIISLLMRFLAFLDGLFTGEPVEMPIRSEEALAPRMPGGLPPEFAEMMGDAAPSPFWDYVQYVVLAGLAFLFLMFMIKPLLNRSGLFRGLGALPAKAFAFFAAWFSALGLGLKGFFTSLRGDAGGRKLVDNAALRSIEESILEGYSAAKKRDMRRSIGLFSRLIYWGQEVWQVHWKPSYAPLEYCRLLAAAATAEEAENGGKTAHAVLRAGALFDRALYSSRPLTRPERDEFMTLVEQVTMLLR